MLQRTLSRAGAASTAHARSLSTTIDASRLTVTRTAAPKPHVAKEKLQFGVTTTDHFLNVDWDVTDVRAPRWARPRAQHA